MAQSQAIQKTDFTPGEIMSQVITKGDLIHLSPEQRAGYYSHLCASLSLNPLTKPFDFIERKNRDGLKSLSVYANKDCASQLRRNHKVSIDHLEIADDGDYLTVTAYASLPDEQKDVDISVVCLKGLIGEDRANAIKKAVTQAKRRVSLSICGLGFLDESEVSSIPNARPIAEEEIVVSSKANGLDQWKCGRKLAMELIGVCKRLEAAGVGEEEMRTKLPQGIASRKDLSPEQAQQVILDFNQWLDSLTNTIQGEVV